MSEQNLLIPPTEIACIVFDFGFTLSSDLYFKVAPPECPDWLPLIQQHIFTNDGLVNDWMRGTVTLSDIAEELSPVVNMKAPRILTFLELGCRNLVFNEAVWNFAMRERDRGKKTAIVTGNMDVFTAVVVPCHGLNDKFDVIINSFDYQEIDKSVLWAKAFQLLGNDIGYSQSLLIEDGEGNVRKFREHGGCAYQYRTDEDFLIWLESIGWN